MYVTVYNTTPSNIKQHVLLQALDQISAQLGPQKLFHSYEYYSQNIFSNHF